MRVPFGWDLAKLARSCAPEFKWHVMRSWDGMLFRLRIDSSQFSRSSPSLGGLPIIVVFKQDPNPRILMFSQRNASKRLPFRCAHFEFEGVISHIDAVDLLA